MFLKKGKYLEKETFLINLSKGTDHRQQATQVKRQFGGTALKNDAISDRVEQSQPAFTIPSLLGKHASPLS